MSDNFGTTWASGVYGAEGIAHVIGAWQIFEHSGNRTYLEQLYAFYKELFWDGIHGTAWYYAYDSVLCLNKMAEVLGHAEDAAHWNATVSMDSLSSTLRSQWDATAGMFGGKSGDGYGLGNFAPTGISMFPREWVMVMATRWLDDDKRGFDGRVPLTNTVMEKWPPPVGNGPEVDHNSARFNFGVTPDGNWYMIRGLYR